MSEQSQMRDVRERVETVAGIANSFTLLAQKHLGEHDVEVVGKALTLFLAGYLSRFSDPCELVEQVMNSVHDTMHALGLVLPAQASEEGEEESLESIPEEEFFHA